MTPGCPLGSATRCHAILIWEKTKMKNRQLSITLFLMLALAACNLPGPKPAVDQGAVGTVAALTLTAFSAGQVTLTATPTVAVAVSLTPTLTPTFSSPMLFFDGATNCRSGPGTEYDVVAVMKDGDKAAILNRSPSGNYWVIKSPNGKGPCWVAGDYARAEGSVQTLPLATVPPTPTLQAPGKPTWQNYTYNCTFASGGSNVTVSLIWSDRSSNEDGYNLYRDGELIASLGPDTTTYTDTAFVGAGQSLSYYVEAYNNAGGVQSPVINITCG